MSPQSRFRASRSSRITILAATVAVGLVVTACSSSKSSGSSSSPAAGSSGASSSVAQKSFSVGFLGPLSGSLSALGSAWLGGLKDSLAYQASQGGAYKITVNAQDDQNMPSLATTEAKSIYTTNALAITGIPASNIGAVIAPLAEANKVPVIGTGILPPTSTYTYAAGLDITQTFSDEVPLIKYLATQNGRTSAKLALLASDTASGHKSVAPVAPLLAGSNVTISNTQYIPVTVTSFDTEAAQVVASHADIVGVTNTATSLLPIVKALRNAGFTGPIVNYWAGASLSTMKQLNDDQLYVYRDFSDPSEDAAATMRKDAAAAGGSDPTSFVNGNYYTQGWVVGQLLMSTLKACGSSCTAQTFNTALQTSASSVNTPLAGANGFSTTNHTFLKQVSYWTWDKTNQKQIPVAGLPKADAPSS